MGSEESYPMTVEPNIVDYSVNVTLPEDIKQINPRFGPNTHRFPSEGKDLVVSDFNECLKHDPGLVSKYQLCRIAVFICTFTMSVAAIAIVYFGLQINEDINEINSSAVDMHNEANDGYTQDLKEEETEDAALETVFGLLAVIAMVIAALSYSRRNQAAREWRDGLADKLRLKLSEWKSKYPHLEFTVISPVNVWKDGGLCKCRSKRRDGKLIESEWCFVRVHQGPCLLGSPVDERIYATTAANPQDGPQMTMMQNQQGIQMTAMQNPQQYGQIQPQNPQQYGQQLVTKQPAPDAVPVVVNST